MKHQTIVRWLEANTAVEPSLLGGPGLEALIAERLAAFNGDESAYVEVLRHSPDELDRLFAGIAVPETWLFRYPRSFDVLLEYCGKLLLENAPVLRMLSVGCATGQEACCMALVAREAGWPGAKIQIRAIDRNQDFLDAAKKGEFSAASIRNEMPGWAMSALHREHGRIRMDRSVTDLIQFSRADITKPGALLGLGPFDVIFCRNILIYLNASAREQLVSMLCAELKSDGLLFVGHAEMGMRGSSPLQPLGEPHAFVLRKIVGSSKEKSRAIASERRLPPVRTEPVTNPAVETPTRASTPKALPSEVGTQPTVEDARDLADAGLSEQAESMVRAIIAREGTSGESLELLGLIRMSRGDPDGAKRLFEEAVYLEPDRAASLLQLAMLSERAGDVRRAATFWERAKRSGTAGASQVQVKRREASE